MASISTRSHQPEVVVESRLTAYHAIVAAQAVFRAGGSLEAAEKVAYSVLVEEAEDDDEFMDTEATTQAKVLALAASHTLTGSRSGGRSVARSKASGRVRSNHLSFDGVPRGISFPHQEEEAEQEQVLKMKYQHETAGDSAAEAPEQPGYSSICGAPEAVESAIAMFRSLTKTQEQLPETPPRSNKVSTRNEDNEGNCNFLEQTEEMFDDVTRVSGKPGSMELVDGARSWVATSFKESTPFREASYFPETEARCHGNILSAAEQVAHYVNKTEGIAATRVVSVCIPCYNEESESLERTIESLKSQKLPKGVLLEVVVVLDGVVQLSSSMAEYICTLFGISFDIDSPKNPFHRLEKGNVVVVESTSPENELGGRMALLSKRKNKRKVNSHMWWLRAHAESAACVFALTTDCGIIFDKDALAQLIARMDGDTNISGLTGFQRVMTANQQGDGVECLMNPFAYLLRLVQRFDMEVSPGDIADPLL